MTSPQLRNARTPDVRGIRTLVGPYVESKAIVDKPVVSYFESLSEFVVVELDGEIVGCGALHVIWENVAEVRTLAVSPTVKGRGIGSMILDELVRRARAVGVSRVFCLTFETAFFGRHGFVEIEGAPIVRRDDGSWLMAGLTPIGDVTRSIGADATLLPQRGQYDTLAGFLMVMLRRIPKRTDQVAWQGWRFEVMDVDRYRVDQVMITRQPEPAH